MTHHTAERPVRRQPPTGSDLDTPGSALRTDEDRLALRREGDGKWVGSILPRGVTLAKVLDDYADEKSSGAVWSSADT